MCNLTLIICLPVPADMEGQRLPYVRSVRFSHILQAQLRGTNRRAIHHSPLEARDQKKKATSVTETALPRQMRIAGELHLILTPSSKERHNLDVSQPSSIALVSWPN